MVNEKLKSSGLPEHTRKEVIESAAQALNRRSRIQSVMIGAAGLGLVCAGLATFILHIKLAAAVTMVGLIVTIYGFYNSTQKFF